MDPLLLIVIVLLVLWLGGVGFVGGTLVHTLLVIALVLLLVRALRGL